ncbi:hypothetical protein JST56_00340 [Candidatus Dependentiae bacterium]|nr:hypothetical protein [Candidatus Dependentiae bacterium]
MKTFKHFVNGLVLVAVLAGNAMAVTPEQLRTMANRGKLVAGEKTLLIEGGFAAIAKMFANNGAPLKGKTEAARLALNQAALVAEAQLREQADLERMAANQAELERERAMALAVTTPMVEEEVLDDEEEVALNQAALVAEYQQREQADLERMAANQAELERQRAMTLVVRGPIPMQEDVQDLMDEENDSDYVTSDDEDSVVDSNKPLTRLALSIAQKMDHADAGPQNVTVDGKSYSATLIAATPVAALATFFANNICTMVTHGQSAGPVAVAIGVGLSVVFVAHKVTSFACSKLSVDRKRKGEFENTPNKLPKLLPEFEYGSDYEEPSRSIDSEIEESDSESNSESESDSDSDSDSDDDMNPVLDNQDSD